MKKLIPNKLLRRKLYGFAMLSAALAMGCGWTFSNLGIPVGIISVVAAVVLIWAAWEYLHVIWRRFNLFSAEMETVSREKGLTQKVSDLTDSSQLVAQVSEEQVAAVMRHTKNYKFGVPGLSKAATDYIMGRRLVKQTVFNDNLATPIIGFVGDVGSGKTMGMIEAAMKFRGQGYKIIGNDEGLGADYVYTSLEELYEIMDMSVIELYRTQSPPKTNTLILFDEIQNTFDSRDFRNFDPRFWSRVTQRRKYGFHAMWTAPKEEYVDIRIRQMTKWIWHCSITPLLKRFKRECYPPLEDVVIGERPRAVTKTFLRENVINEYNTFAFISSFSKRGGSVKEEIVGRMLSEDEKKSPEMRKKEDD